MKSHLETLSDNVPGGLENRDADADIDEYEAHLARLRSAIPAKPDWNDDEAMAAWLDAVLKIEKFEEDAREHEVREWEGSTDHYVIDQALELNYEPLARHLEWGAPSRFVLKWIGSRLREMQSGRPGFAVRTKQSEKKALLDAADDVPRIKRLWREHYGRVNRGENGNLKTAIVFAAERHGVDKRSLAKHLKRLTEKYPIKKKKPPAPSSRSR